MGVACGIVAATGGGTPGTQCVLEAGKGCTLHGLAATRRTLELNGFCVKYAIVLSHLMLAH